MGMKIFMDTVGCRLNQSEIEKIANQFRQLGHQNIDQPLDADVAIINSCTVTSKAESDSRQKIRQAVNAGAKEVWVTGCLATIDPEKTMAIPGVSGVIGNQDKDNLVSNFDKSANGGFNIPVQVRYPLPGIHSRTRAFIKIQDGCDNHCTYCATRIARGPARSMPIQEILADIRSAIAGGVLEIVLTGVNLASWGKEIPASGRLHGLVDQILQGTSIHRLRLSSVEPWELTGDFFEILQNPRVCRHLHLPLQSGSISVLHRMARKTTPNTYQNLVSVARSYCPDIAITTDVMVGFPGESDAEFLESLQFVENMGFAGGHVFSFSPRPGTAAAGLLPAIPEEIKRERNRLMRNIFTRTGQDYRQKFIQKNLSVLWEGSRAQGDGSWYLNGLSDNYIKVYASSPKRLCNQIDQVFLEDEISDGLIGRIVGIEDDNLV